MSFDVWAYLSDHIFWRHGTRECKTLYIHGNMYHDRKTDRVDHGIYSTICGFRAAGDVKFTMIDLHAVAGFCVELYLPWYLREFFIWDRSQCGSECLQTGRSVELFIQYDLKIENGLLIR